MVLPDYNKSIVNLMSSVMSGFGSRSIYKNLEEIPSKELKKSKNVVLLVIDGLGYNYLSKKSSFLRDNLKCRITSVFPSTTASAITTFLTGTAPQQHGITGWFMLLKEIGIVSRILPFGSRIKGLSFRNKLKIGELLNSVGFTDRIKESSYMIQHKDIVNSDFSKAMAKKSKKLGYSTLDGFFRQIKKAIKSHNRRKYVYAYWPLFDSVCHEYGVNSWKAEKHFYEIDKRIRKLIKGIDGTNTTLIVTADHGLIDTDKKKVITLDDHPELKECLTLILCGEPRTAYCYVHPSKAKKFESYVKKNLNECCTLYKSEYLLKNNYFGLFKPNPKLVDRIGDYILVMKKNYIIKDSVLGQKKSFHIGNHGGISADEMFVPLIVFKL
ncbi:hypothetical protein D6745_02050 [Candidatus Woesearchaeota archaeon]|nr:MAG: hypothetical protein D6745_02050 [Candidatus Woesearchaeota archaeon]